MIYFPPNRSPVRYNVVVALESGLCAMPASKMAKRISSYEAAHRSEVLVAKEGHPELWNEKYVPGNSALHLLTLAARQGEKLVLDFSRRTRDAPDLVRLINSILRTPQEPL